MLKDAQRRRFDVVMAWAIDRLGRSLIDLRGTIQTLEHCGVGSAGDRHDDPRRLSHVSNYGRVRRVRAQHDPAADQCGTQAGRGKELVDAAIRMAVDDLADHIDQVGVRIDAVEFAGLDQRSNDRPVFAAAVGTGEERVLPVQCDWADTTFDDIGIDLDATVIDEAGGTSPARQRIADCLGELALLTDQSELGAQPRLKVSMIGRLLSWGTVLRSLALRPRISFSIA